MYYGNELYHHGILGQKWGVRRYQNEDGTLTDAGKKRYLDSSGHFNKAGERFAEKQYAKAYEAANWAQALATGTSLGADQAHRYIQSDSKRLQRIGGKHLKKLDSMSKNDIQRSTEAAKNLEAAVNLVNTYKNTSTRALEVQVSNKLYDTGYGEGDITMMLSMQVEKIKFRDLEKVIAEATKDAEDPEYIERRLRGQ